MTPTSTRISIVTRALLSFVLVVGLTATAIGCGSEPATSSDGEFTVGGTVSGLDSTLDAPLVLQNNGEDDLEIEENGAFVFSEPVADGEDYAVSVASSPDDHSCSVESGSGTIDGADIDEVDVECTLTDVPPERAEFAVTINAAASDTFVEEGETVEIVADIDNTSDISDTQDISLEIDGDTEDTTSVDLDAGDTETVTLQWETEIGDAGENGIVVSSPDASDTLTVVVEEKDTSHFAVDIDTDATPTSVYEDQLFVIEAQIENQGDGSGTQDIDFRLNDQLEERAQDITLDEGASTTVEFSWQTQPGDEGDYTATIESDDVSDDVEFSVLVAEQPVLFTVEIDAGDSTLEVDEGDTVTVAATITNDGVLEGTQDVELVVGGEIRDTEDAVELSDGESVDIGLDWETDAGDVGYHNVEIHTDNHADSAIATVGQPDADEATLTGAVIDASTDDPVAGVDVLLFEEGSSDLVDSDTTSAAGAYIFSGVEPGDYDILLEAPGLEPNYEIEEAGGDATLALSLPDGGLVEQDLTMSWLAQTDLIIDGGALQFQTADGDELDVAFPGCEQNSDGSWDPQDPEIDDDDIELSFEPDDDCYRINGVGIDIATGDFTVSPDDALFPTIIIFMDDDDDDFDEMVDSVEIELEWLIDDVDGQVDFTDGSMDVDLDLRILVGGTAHTALQAIDFGSREEEFDCQLTGAWGGDVDDPRDDTNDEQIGDFLHDSIEMRLTTEESGADGAQGVAYDPDVGLVVVIDHELTIDRISEGSVGDGNDDPGGAGCGDIDMFGLFAADYAQMFNDLIGLPTSAGDVLLEFEMWLD